MTTVLFEPVKDAPLETIAVLSAPGVELPCLTFVSEFDHECSDCGCSDKLFACPCGGCKKAYCFTCLVARGYMIVGMGTVTRVRASDVVLESQEKGA